jgi:hypothetical protein
MQQKQQNFLGLSQEANYIKLVSTFVDRGFRVVSASDLLGP